MINSKISICNLALAAIGEDAIRDFDEGNKRARMCDVFYESTRDYVLAQFAWPFARRQTELKQLTTSVNWHPDGTYVYSLPVECHQPLDLWPEGSMTNWEVSGTELTCRLDNVDADDTVVLIYTGKEMNPTKFSSQFIYLLSIALAVRICPSLTQDKELTKTVFQQYEMGKTEAWGTDAAIGNKQLHNDENPAFDSFVDPDYSFTQGTE